jgi:subtilisin family serine protease
VLFDLDHLDNMEKDPVEFVRRLKLSLLSHRRTGGSVSMSGTTVANVVWSGHVDLTPVLKIQDFQAINVTYDANELEALGFQMRRCR